MIRPKNATPPAPISPNKKAHKARGGGLPATVEHRTPIRANVSKSSDAENTRQVSPAIPSETSLVDDLQIARLKVFKNSRAMYQEEDKYFQGLTTYAACDEVKDWSPRGQSEDP